MTQPSHVASLPHHRVGQLGPNKDAHKHKYIFAHEHKYKSAHEHKYIHAHEHKCPPTQKHKYIRAHDFEHKYLSVILKISRTILNYMRS